jgi:hypothetical protein
LQHRSDIQSERFRLDLFVSEDREVLIAKADRQPPLVILRMSLAAEIAKP